MYGCEIGLDRGFYVSYIMRHMALENINGGAVMWADIKGEVQDYEKEKANFALYTRGQ